jgi:hypothetical protein
MSFLVTVTFDLRNAHPSKYRKVHGDLAKIDLSKFVSGKKHIDKKLPANTFVAEFAEEFEDDSSKETVAYIKKNILKIFEKRKVKGRYFVAVGRKWAWHVGRAG